MTANAPTLFDRCFDILIGHEGGFQKNPADLGNYAHGKLVGTKYGISARSYPNENIPGLTLDRAKQIYLRDFWNAAGINKISNPALALAIFDTAVNSGAATALKLYKPGMTVDQYLDARLTYLRSLAGWAEFGRGWAARVAKLRVQCKGMS